MMVASWALLAGLIVLAGVVAGLVVLLMKYPKPTLITLAVLIVLVPLLGILFALLAVGVESRHMVEMHPQPIIQAEHREDISDRTWVTEPAAFINAHPQRKFLIARHTRVAVSETEAIDEARMSAAGMLVSHLGTPRADGPHAYLPFVDDLTVDRFVERTERPYGDIWSAALLLDVSPERIHPVQVAVQDQWMRRASSTRWTIVASIALFVVMWLIYLGLNAITRGYYAWRLRAVGIFCVIGVIMLVMLRFARM